MAQTPATPKPKRALLRAAAFLAPAIASRLAPQPSEAAALAARKRPLACAEAAQVIFLIPLVGRHQIKDWAGVCARLARTVESFRRQSSPAWRALICGQDRPTGLPEDSRVRFVPFTEAVVGNDKWRKLAALAHALPGSDATQGYAMPFDADDLLAPGAVAEMVERQCPGGYLVTHGLVHDATAGIWAQAEPQSLRHPRQKAFWKLCGSCAAFGFDLRSGTDDAALIAAITAHEHRMFPYLAALAARPLAPLRQNAAAYILNHGDNFGARRGRVASKTRFAARYALTEPASIAAAQAAFPL